jgi:hypothetical protein
MVFAKQRGPNNFAAFLSWLCALVSELLRLPRVLPLLALVRLPPPLPRVWPLVHERIQPCTVGIVGFGDINGVRLFFFCGEY